MNEEGAEKEYWRVRCESVPSSDERSCGSLWTDCGWAPRWGSVCHSDDHDDVAIRAFLRQRDSAYGIAGLGVIVELGDADGHIPRRTVVNLPIAGLEAFTFRFAITAMHPMP